MGSKAFTEFAEDSSAPLPEFCILGTQKKYAGAHGRILP
jgi:hypothetical protein